ncbi:MAG: hypothetical protein Q4P72_06945, partial [Eubacteriales bacterium]|nr:hypothetical protein [Eubacteriales bacterium]
VATIILILFISILILDLLSLFCREYLLKRRRHFHSIKEWKQAQRLRHWMSLFAFIAILLAYASQLSISPKRFHRGLDIG